MSFQQGRKLSKYLMYGSALILFAAALTNRDLPVFSTILAFAGLALCLCGAVATIILCRCPFCRGIIVVGALTRRSCPHCDKRFDGANGKGTKGSGTAKKAKK